MIDVGWQEDLGVQNSERNWNTLQFGRLAVTFVRRTSCAHYAGTEKETSE